VDDEGELATEALVAKPVAKPVAEVELAEE